MDYSNRRCNSSPHTVVHKCAHVAFMWVSIWLTAGERKRETDSIVSVSCTFSFCFSSIKFSNSILCHFFYLISKKKNKNSGGNLISANIGMPSPVEYLDISYNDITTIDNECFKVSAAMSSQKKNEFETNERKLVK